MKFPVWGHFQDRIVRSEDVTRATRLTGMRVTRLPKTATFAALTIDFKMEEGIPTLRIGKNFSTVENFI